MVKVNQDYLKLRGSYLFSEIGRRVNEFAAENTGERIIRLGIGDVTKPLPPTVIRAQWMRWRMKKLLRDMLRISVMNF